MGGTSVMVTVIEGHLVTDADRCVNLNRANNKVLFEDTA